MQTFATVATMIVAASAQLDITSLMLMDQFSGHGYGHGSRFGDVLPLLALNGGLTGAAGSTDLANYFLVN